MGSKQLLARFSPHVFALGASSLLPAQNWIGERPAWHAAMSTTFDAASGHVLQVVGMMQYSVYTLRFDGTRWQAIHGPLDASTHPTEIVYDSVRNRTVMLDGMLATWLFDGTDWTRVPNTPTLRSEFRMAFDAARGKTVLFGGFDGNNAVLADTWLFDGSTWSQQITANAPAARMMQAMVFDSLRNRIVLHGGFDLLRNPFTDTWEYDGVNWTQVNTPTVPTMSWGDGVAFDPVRGVTVLGRTWEYNGTNWTPIATVTTPPQSGPMSYDVGRRCVVMPLGNQTWFYDGINWSSTTSNAAPVFQNAAMAYDQARRRVVVFGGDDFYQMLARHWEYNGTWIQRTFANAPSARTWALMVYDPANRRCLLHGGYGAIAYRDTWTFDGNNWQLLHALGPANGRAMAYDEARHRTVLLCSAGPGLPGITWEHDGTNWMRTTTPVEPPGEAGAMAYDARRNRMVLSTLNSPAWETWEYDGTWTNTGIPTHWGQHPTLAFDPIQGRIIAFDAKPWPNVPRTWQFDGSAWTAVPTPAVSPANWGVRLVFDRGRGRMLMHGGLWYDHSAPYPEQETSTWLFEPAHTATSTSYGVGCAHSAGTPSLVQQGSTPPSLGSTVTWIVNTALPGSGIAALGAGFDLTQWNGQPLPLDLGPLGLPGCSSWISIDAWFLVSATSGVASFPLTVPNNPLLGGVTLGLQALVLDPASSTGIGAVSNAVIVRTW